jgi:hypothetical protein
MHLFVGTLTGTRQENDAIQFASMSDCTCRPQVNISDRVERGSEYPDFSHTISPFTLEWAATSAINY